MIHRKSRLKAAVLASLSAMSVLAGSTAAVAAAPNADGYHDHGYRPDERHVVKLYEYTKLTAVQITAGTTSLPLSQCDNGGVAVGGVVPEALGGTLTVGGTVGITVGPVQIGLGNTIPITITGTLAEPVMVHVATECLGAKVEYRHDEEHPYKHEHYKHEEMHPYKHEHYKHEEMHPYKHEDWF
jgi:hypothetical protein